MSKLTSVLLVDDDATTNYLNKILLTRLNVAEQLLVAENGRQALTLLNQTCALQAQLLAAAQHQAAERLAFYQISEQTSALVALLRAPGHRFEYVNPA